MTTHRGENVRVTVYRFGTTPSLVLKDWDYESMDARDYVTPRALALYEALEADPADEEYVLARHRSEDRWGLFGFTREGHAFAVEEPESH